MFFTIITFATNGVYYIFSVLYYTFSLFHTVLPFGLDVGLVGVAAYYYTRLRKADSDNVRNIFGLEPGSKESEFRPEETIRCIAHRGAGLDAPENTLEAFKYCVERNCKFIEMDVRSLRDGRLILLHDSGLQRLTGTHLGDLHALDWDTVKDIDIGVTHPNRKHFKEVHLCLLDDAINYLLDNDVKMVLDIKGEDKEVINGILQIFESKPALYRSAVVTCFNPFVLYQIRRRDPAIVGAISYRPYVFSAQEYDAEKGPSDPRFAENLPLHALLRICDVLHAATWRWTARWCGVSAVLVHKDIVSRSEVEYWRNLGVKCVGWCVNRPLEKLYWRGVMRSPYLANTLLGESDIKKRVEEKDKDDDQMCYMDKMMDEERKFTETN